MRIQKRAVMGATKKAPTPYQKGEQVAAKAVFPALLSGSDVDFMVLNVGQHLPKRW
jgi:hypothetical protein